MIGKRIKTIRTERKITQDEFAKKIGLTKNYISLVETGERTPSDRTISDICRVFGVNELWLRTGVGDPKRPVSKQEQLAEIFADVLNNSPGEKSRFIRAAALLPDEAYPVLVDAIMKFAQELSGDLEEEKQTAE